MAVRWAIANGAFSNTSTWNDGGVLGIPTTGDDVFTNSFTVNMDVDATVNSMNNSVLAAQNTRRNPIMTSNTAPSGVASASTAVNPAWNAFDGNTSNDWGGAAPPQWIQYQFTSSLIIRSYSIFYRGGTDGYPTNFNLQGSNDGISFTTLDTRTGFVYTLGQYNTFTITAPYSAYSYYRLNITAVNAGNARMPELSFNEAGITTTVGGSFNFNTAGVTVSATSTSASLSAGATNLISVTATTGTVTLNLGSAVTGLNIASQIINHTGACNFNLSGIRFSAGTISNSLCINKSSTGTISITGDLVGGPGGSGNNSAHALNSTSGNTVVVGNVFASLTNTSFGILQTAGNITVTGNVIGGAGTNIFGISLTGAASQFTINGNVTGGNGTTSHGINFGGTLGIINGNVTGGSGTNAHGVNTSTGGVNVTGNVIGNIGYGLAIVANSTIIGNVFAGSAGGGIGQNNNNSFTVTVTGDVYASATQVGIQLIGTGTQVVNLTGNMYNTLGRMAIWCPNVFINDTVTTLWRMDTGGGAYKFLYSADTTPNLPVTTNVRSGTTFGPALSLTGTMVVPATSDVRENVPVDNTVGTGELTSADIINGINASSDSLAVRLKNILTDQSAGNIISQYKNS
jgi:hypothetical protein